MDLSAVWERALTAMQARTGPQNVEIWLRPTHPVRLDGGVLVLEVSNRYYSDWIADNLLESLREEIGKVAGRRVDVEFIYREDAATEDGPAPSANGSGAQEPRGLGVNAGQTFQTFVVGECNKFAHAAARAVSDAPAKAYNPLFIYGATGLGKTHLMHAIANEILLRDPHSRIVYVTAEDFTNDMINGIRFKRMDDFRARYRKLATVLLVDDIQFLSGKDGTQEEFFHTFNALQSLGRQIVLSADVLPKEIDKLEPRLRTRFEGGLQADMQAPNKETLLAILHQKAQGLRFTVPSDVALAIAQHVAGNVRELEGVLTRLSALHTFYKQALSLEFVREKLPDLFSTPKSAPITVTTIIEAVARYHALRPADLTGDKRTRTMTRPRHIAMYLARRHTGISFPELGREFGGRDHSTIQNGCHRIEEDLVDNPDLAYKLKIIEQGLGIASR